jgi:hypothetical protein
MADKANTRHDRASDRHDRAAEKPHDLVPDLMGVASRVSWSAILAGTVIALACFTAFTFFFAALGITITDAGVRDRAAIGVGALVAGIFTIVVSLFLGGWVAAQMTVGENRREAVIYGLLTWGAVTIASLAMVAMGVRAGYFAAVGGSAIVQSNERLPTWEELAVAQGASQQNINTLKATIDPARMNDPANKDRAREAAMYAAWIALVGTLLSMAACIGGAMVGRGVAFHLYPVRVVRDDRPGLVVPANP